MTDAGRGVVAPLVLGAWDAFLEVAQGADLGRRTRLPGWRGHEVCVHLGSWDDYRALEGLVDVARARDERLHAIPDVQAANERVVAAHRSASREEVLAALRRHRDAVAAHLAHGPASLDGDLTASPVGPLPLLSVILGEAYELAVHALDLHDAGAPRPAPELLQAGLAALADVTGALAASTGVRGGATLQAPDGGWSFAAGEGGPGWTVTRTPPGGVRGSGGTVVAGEAATLLDASAGRANAVVALARRRITVTEMGGLLRLAPIVEAAPNIPGGPLLQLAARSLSGAGGLLGRLRR